MVHGGGVPEARVGTFGQPGHARGEDPQDVAAFVVDRGRGAVPGILARSHPVLAAGAVGVAQGPAVTGQQVCPVGVVVVSGCWSVVTCGDRGHGRRGYRFDRCQQSEQPPWCLGDLNVIKSAAVFPLVLLTAGRVQGWRCHDLSACATDV